MFISVQIPFVDFRIIRDVQPEHYFFPNYFPIKQINNRTYYRCFGPKAIRGNCLQVPVSEQSYFDSHSTLKLKLSDNPYNARVVFTRLYTDKYFFHFDIGIRVESKNVMGEDVETLLSNLLSNLYTVDRRPSENKQKVTFPQFIDYLRKLYIYATTHLKLPITDAQISAATIKIMFGKVGIFVKDNKKVLIYNNFVNANLENNISLKVKNVFINNDSNIHSNIWLISKMDRDIVRELSICLSKLHCFRECIHLTLEYLGSFKDYGLLDTQKLKRQFHYFTQLYNRDCYHGQSIYNIEDAAFEANIIVDGVTWDNYYQTIIFYRNIFNNMQAPMVNNNINIYSNN